MTLCNRKCDPNASTGATPKLEQGFLLRLSCRAWFPTWPVHSAVQNVIPGAICAEVGAKHFYGSLSAGGGVPFNR